ncbi:GDP-mannose-dependent alpha-(1-6)-phosphatidylinositol monomannoside mannosyltransferase [Stieleria maiorica]|uniref:GDP-mannose-dependent alpha-(1-6)-phosphatidylinositol monomannoside mannosyltransferase n=1 Tax=Stieleria maiorica TaxID=2795974 RepID=A0A5B9MLH4_9BACT|nr:glycosyltransferase [Stieleria maiorica]QEG00495.1 GDP-mannose-dependent alpha-(1-6)-phosphatidylinositol monomannoside mannosyltransferase [Stieleria maiorica]
MPDQRKRVLLMVSSMRGGGSERQVLLLSQTLDRSRFEPHLYLTAAAGEFLGQVPSDVPIHSFDSCRDSGRVYFPGRQLRRQTEFLRGVIRDNKIDVVYDRTFHMTLIAGKAAAGVRRVSTIVSPPHLALPLVEKRFVALKRRRLAAAYRGSDVVVAVSGQAAQSAESYYGLPTGSVVVIKNPVDAIGLRKAVGAAPPRYSDQTVLVCVGRMTDEKGHADLIDALAMLQSKWPETRSAWTMRMIGDGPLRGELQARAESLGLESRIQFVGSLASAAAEINAADALVLPSRFEGMPNVVLEAMALGTPVIATRAGGAIELQADAPTAFWADPGNPPSLAQAILEFAANPDQAATQRLAAQQQIESDHAPAAITRQIEQLLSPTAKRETG